MGEAMVIRLFWTNLANPPLKNSYCQTTLYYRFRKRSGVREGWSGYLRLISTPLPYFLNHLQEKYLFIVNVVPQSTSSM